MMRTLMIGCLDDAETSSYETEDELIDILDYNFAHKLCFS